MFNENKDEQLERIILGYISCNKDASLPWNSDATLIVNSLWLTNYWKSFVNECDYMWTFLLLFIGSFFAATISGAVGFGGAVVGLISGLVGSAGPIGSALFLSLDLIPLSYISSEAVTSVAMHLAKTIVYEKYMGVGLYTLSIGLFMGIAMIPGTWAGRKIIGKMSKENFVNFVGVLITVTGLQMLIFG